MMRFYYATDRQYVFQSSKEAERTLGKSGKGKDLNGMPKAAATGSVTPTLEPPSDKLAAERTYSHHGEAPRWNKRRWAPKVRAPKSNSRLRPMIKQDRTARFIDEEDRKATLEGLPFVNKRKEWA